MKLKAIFYLLMIIPYLVLNVVFLIMYSCLDSYKSFMSVGLLVDLWECHKQYKGISRQKIKVTIDDIIPEGL